MSNFVFKNFDEFFYLTKSLNCHQRNIIINELSSEEKEYLNKIISSEGWQDLFIRNEIDNILDLIKSDFGEDLIQIRIQVLSGNVKKVKKSFWNYVTDIFSGFDKKYTDYIFSGVFASNQNLEGDWVILMPNTRR